MKIDSTPPEKRSPSPAGYPRSKRALDIVLSGLALVALAPIMAVIAGLVRVGLGAPILFRQQRPGLGGRPFRILKFRTMLPATDETGRPMSEADRLTRLGRWLRASSLDELPELINVLRGDMSLVGPRPLLMEYLPLYSPEQARRHDVRPGITGLAQVSGRNAITWEEKFALDVWYVDHACLRLDVEIIGRTALKVLKREGITPEGGEIMPKFQGSSGIPS